MQDYFSEKHLQSLHTQDFLPSLSRSKDDQKMEKS